MEYHKPDVVFVLGSGASADYGFPLGRELKRKIILACKTGGTVSKMLDGDKGTQAAIREFHQSFLRSPYASVDAFLQRWPELANIGKTAIAVALIPHEKEDTLFTPKEPTWYEYLWQWLTEHGGSNINEKNAGFVTFNYDRSLEHFLYSALRYGNKMSSEDAVKHLNGIAIVHMYGQLGPLPYMDANGVGRLYDEIISTDSVRLAASTIRVIGEGAQKEARQRAWELMMSAKTFCFLGFGYLMENLKQLPVEERVSTHNDNPAEWFGSAYGLGEGEKKRLTTGLFKNYVLLGERDEDCLQFLKANLILK